MKIQRKVAVDAPIEKLWDILGTNYADAGVWNSAVFISAQTAFPPKVESAPVSGRVCQTTLGPFTETINQFDEETHRIEYTATGDAMPGFVKGLHGHWSLKKLSAKRTEVNMMLSVNIAFPFNVLMGWMMKMQFNGAIKSSLGDLKHYAETGKPHPRKIKADGTKKARTARQALA